MRHQLKILAIAVAGLGLGACNEANVKDTSYSGSDVSEAARSACVRAVSNETGERNVVVSSTDY